MLHEVFCAVCCDCVIVGFGSMCLCHLFVVYLVMLHWLFVCVVVSVCRFVCGLSCDVVCCVDVSFC